MMKTLVWATTLQMFSFSCHATISACATSADGIAEINCIAPSVEGSHGSALLQRFSVQAKVPSKTVPSGSDNNDNSNDDKEDSGIHIHVHVHGNDKGNDDNNDDDVDNNNNPDYTDAKGDNNDNNANNDNNNDAKSNDNDDNAKEDDNDNGKSNSDDNNNNDADNDNKAKGNDNGDNAKTDNDNNDVKGNNNDNDDSYRSNAANNNDSDNDNDTRDANDDDNEGNDDNNGDQYSDSPGEHDVDDEDNGIPEENIDEHNTKKHDTKELPRHKTSKADTRDERENTGNGNNDDRDEIHVHIHTLHKDGDDNDDESNNNNNNNENNDDNAIAGSTIIESETEYDDDKNSKLDHDSIKQKNGNIANDVEAEVENVLIAGRHRTHASDEIDAHASDIRSLVSKTVQASLKDTTRKHADVSEDHPKEALSKDTGKKKSNNLGSKADKIMDSKNARTALTKVSSEITMHAEDSHEGSAVSKKREASKVSSKVNASRHGANIDFPRARKSQDNLVDKIPIHTTSSTTDSHNEDMAELISQMHASKDKITKELEALKGRIEDAERFGPGQVESGGEAAEDTMKNEAPKSKKAPKDARSQDRDYETEDTIKIEAPKSKKVSKDARSQDRDYDTEDALMNEAPKSTKVSKDARSHDRNYDTEDTIKNEAPQSKKISKDARSQDRNDDTEMFKIVSKINASKMNIEKELEYLKDGLGRLSNKMEEAQEPMKVVAERGRAKAVEIKDVSANDQYEEKDRTNKFEKAIVETRSDHEDVTEQMTRPARDESKTDPPNLNIREKLNSLKDGLDDIVDDVDGRQMGDKRHGPNFRSKTISNEASGEKLADQKQTDIQRQLKPLKDGLGDISQMIQILMRKVAKVADNADYMDDVNDFINQDISSHSEDSEKRKASISKKFFDAFVASIGDLNRVKKDIKKVHDDVKTLENNLKM